MIPIIVILLTAALAACGSPGTPSAAAAPTDLLPPMPVPTAATRCLPTGDGYLRAHLAGAIDATLDWPNSGTQCLGEFRDKPPGVRLSFQRAAGGDPNLLLVFGLTGVRAGAAAHEVGTNLTVIMQGTSRIYGTLGDTRCTVDSLTQRPLSPTHPDPTAAMATGTAPATATAAGTATATAAGPASPAAPASGPYRLEARGFCTQPAHAIRGEGDVLVSTFEFAGLVNY